MAKTKLEIGKAYCLGMTISYAVRLLKQAQLRGEQQTMFYDVQRSTKDNLAYVSYEQAFSQLESYKKRNFECLPMCDNTDEKGNCLGHER
jgi:hypothetical protein